MRTVGAAIIAMAIVLSGCAAGTPSPTSSEPPATAAEPTPDITGEVYTPIVTQVLDAPVPATMSDGRTHLAYELILSNATGSDVTIDDLRVLAPDGAPLGSFSGPTLLMKPIGVAAAVTTLSPGLQVVALLDVVLPEGATAPTALIHELALTVAVPNPPLTTATMTETMGPIEVSATPRSSSARH